MNYAPWKSNPTPINFTRREGKGDRVLVIIMILLESGTTRVVPFLSVYTEMINMLTCSTTKKGKEIKDIQICTS